MQKYILTFTIYTLIFFTFFVKKVYSAEIYFDYYGVKSVNTGATISGNANIQLTIPCEAYNFLKNENYNLDPEIESPLGNKTGVTIRYISHNSTIFPRTTIIFKFENIKISPLVKKCWLLFHEFKGIDSNKDGIGDTDFDLNKNGFPFDIVVAAESINNLPNSKEIVFNVLRQVPAGGILYLACAEESEPIFTDKIGFNIDGFDTSLNLVIVPANLMDQTEKYGCSKLDSKKGCLTVEALSYYSLEHIKDLETTSSNCFLEIKCQFELGFKSHISIIDQNINLNNPACSNSNSGILKCFSGNLTKYFIDEPSGFILDTDSCTDKNASSGEFFIKQNEIDDPVTLGIQGWKGKLKMKLYDKNNIFSCSNIPVTNKLPYKALDFTNRRIFLDNNGKSYGPRSFGYLEDRIHFKKGDFCYLEANVFSDRNCIEDSSTICIKDDYWEDDIYIGVNGIFELSSIQWGLYAELNIFKDEENMFSLKIDEKSNCFSEQLCCYDTDNNNYFLYWKKYGKEAFIPYMLNSNEFRIIISNNSCWDAEIFARVWDPKGQVADDVYLGKVKANSVSILSGDLIFSKAKQENPLIGVKTAPLYSLILTVSGVNRDIKFNAYDNRAGRTKMIPIYDLSSYSITYRNIDLYEDPF